LHYLYMTSETDKLKYHSLISGYYLGIACSKFQDRLIADQPYKFAENVYNIMKILQLPMALFGAKMWDDLLKIICDIDFYVVACEAKLIQEVMENFSNIVYKLSLHPTVPPNVLKQITTFYDDLFNKPEVLLMLMNKCV